jgi:hypothetical protein
LQRGEHIEFKRLSKRLHNHSFFNIIFDMPFYSHWVCLRSCAGPGAGAWLFACLIIPCFHLLLDVFSFVLQTILSLPHPLALDLTHCICGQSLEPIGIHFLLCAHCGERIAFLDAIRDFFTCIEKDAGFHIL